MAVPKTYADGVWQSIYIDWTLRVVLGISLPNLRFRENCQTCCHKIGENKKPEVGSNSPWSVWGRLSGNLWLLDRSKLEVWARTPVFWWMTQVGRCLFDREWSGCHTRRTLSPAIKAQTGMIISRICITWLFLTDQLWTGWPEKLSDYVLTTFNLLVNRNLLKRRSYYVQLHIKPKTE